MGWWCSEFTRVFQARIGERKTSGVINKYLWEAGLFSSQVSRHAFYPSVFAGGCYFCNYFDFAYSMYANKIKCASTFYGS